MADRPIIFSAPMVRALLDGLKTQTRRLAWSTRKPSLSNAIQYSRRWDGSTPWQKVRAGDRLWVRESFVRCETDKGPTNNVVFRVDFKDLKGDYWSEIAIDPNGVKWHPSIHMPRWASRLTLVITATKIERVQEIGANDVGAEGFRLGLTGRGMPSPSDFRDYWNSLHGKGAWAANPEVVALTFTVNRRNIDA